VDPDYYGETLASSGKKKTTFAKLARESRLRERRLEKQAKKNARKRAAEAQASGLGDTPAAERPSTRPPVPGRDRQSWPGAD
jgi:hypothetical protein